MCLCVWVCVCVCGLVCARGCVFVCGCVSMGLWLCVLVDGFWSEVWDGFVCVCGRVTPHPHTHQHTDARPHVETNRKSCIHPHANTTIHPYTNPHKPTNPTQRHTQTHVHVLPVAKVFARVHWGGGGTRGVRTNEGVHKGEIYVNSGEFTPMNRLQACRVSAPFVLGTVWAWWMLLGRDFHRMMRNEAGARILTPQIPPKEPKIWLFSSENPEIWVNSRDNSRPIRTATYPPFTKGTPSVPSRPPPYPPPLPPPPTKRGGTTTWGTTPPTPR